MAPRSSLFSRIFLSLAALVCGALLIEGELSARALRRHLIEQIGQALRVQAHLAGEVLGIKTADLHRKVRELSAACACRVTFIAPSGKVLADSEVEPASIAGLENHGNRPEVAAALASGAGESSRFSQTIGQDFLYVAAAWPPAGAPAGVIRLALPLTEVAARVSDVRRKLFALVGLVLVAALFVALLLSRAISRPAASMAAAARELAQGRFEVRVLPMGSAELADLGAALNGLADAVQRGISELSREKAHLDTILSSMVEAVATVDEQGRITGLNPAAARLFGIERKEAIGRPFVEAIRHGKLDESLREAMRTDSIRTEEVKILLPQERVFAAQIVPIRREGEPAGALAVLHDVTRLREVEEMRRDFVANASHELRTPIAAIRGMAETLRAGAMSDRAARGEFIEAIENDAIRLGQLVDDLLDLSAIESGRRPPQLSLIDVFGAAEQASRRIAALAKKAGVTISIERTRVPQVLADDAQLGQVFTNLLDNAVKFNKKGGRVVVRARVQDGALAVEVEDTGSGIPAADLPRIFERFYRVDKARSREVGGTGLGLSIVKHIIEAHGGAVGAESSAGRGSTFRFTLPLSS